MTGSSEQKMR